jgi:hypothetical protein
MSQIDIVMQKRLKIVYHKNYKGIGTNIRIQPTKSQLLFFFNESSAVD